MSCFYDYCNCLTLVFVGPPFYWTDFCFYLTTFISREIQKKSALHSLHDLLELFSMMRPRNRNFVACYKMCPDNSIIARIAGVKVRLDRVAAR